MTFHVLMCQRLKYIASGIIQSKKEEIKLAIFVGIMFYIDILAFKYIAYKSSIAGANIDPCLEIMYYECLSRIAEAVFCMIKLSLYAYTSYSEQYNNQENLYFYTRIGKFIATTIIFSVWMPDNFLIETNIVHARKIPLIVSWNRVWNCRGHQEGNEIFQGIPGANQIGQDNEEVIMSWIKKIGSAISRIFQNQTKRVPSASLTWKSAKNSFVATSTTRTVSSTSLNSSRNREWIKTHAICPTCRSNLHNEEQTQVGTNDEEINKERERINALPREQHGLMKGDKEKEMGSVSFSLPKAAVDRDSIEVEKKRVEVESMNSQMLAPKEKKNKQE